MSLSRFFRRRAWDEERARELEAHLAHEIDDNRARGMTPEEARRQAYLRLGNPTLIREEIWEMNSLVSIENLGRDIRYAFRQLLHSPGFAAIAILTLALGLGINTAIFSVVNGLFFSSLNIRNQSRVVEVGLEQQNNAWQPMLSVAEMREIREQTKDAFSGVVGDQFSLDGLSMQGEKPARVFTDYVTGNYFEVLGVQPLVGRFFRPSEGTTAGADPVIVLSYAYWKEHFAGDANIVGRQVSLDGHPVTVVGVAPRSYHGLDTVLAVQAYVPLAMTMTIENTPAAVFNQQDNRDLRVYARLRAGVTKQEANATLAVLARRIASDYPRTEKAAEMRTFPLYAGRLSGLDSTDANEVSALFLGLSGLVLLLACVNVANLLLVRASVREREMVIRSALGAQRSRLIRQMLTESTLLAVLGGAAGIALGLWGSSLLSSVDLQTDLPVRFDFSADWHVFAFAGALALLAGGVVGMVPAMRLARANLNLVLREGGRGVAGARSRFRNALVMVQVGSALMLLIVAGLFMRSLERSAHAKLGFNPANVLTMSMDPSEIGYSDAQARDFFSALLQRVRALPGVESATTGETIPMGMFSSAPDTVTVPGYQLPPGQMPENISYNAIGTDYFRTLEVPLERGRSFTDADNEKGAYVAIVSEAMAKKYWPHEDPIGRPFTMSSAAKHPVQVVGVAGDVHYTNGSDAPGPYFYVPFQQHYAQDSLEVLEVRTASDPAAMIPEMERTIHGMAPELPVFEVKTLHQALYSPDGLLIFEVAAAAAGVMGTLGLILAIVGVYGVLSYVVSRRTGEIGVRMAMGAQRGDILKIVYRQGLWIVGIGLALGLGGAFAAAHILGSMIVVSAMDPVTYVSASAVLAAIALLACYVPARRAMRVDPMAALREE